MVNKFITRREIKDKRAFMPPGLVKRLSGEIARQLFTTDAYRRADTVCFYISVNNEVDTMDMIKHALHNGKRVAAPRIIAPEVAAPKVRDTAMEFVLFSDREELKKGAFGILEPQGDEAAETENALLIMPGVAFDERCNRIGYGGGYYDRYLAEHKVAASIALAYEIQIVKTLQTEHFDVRPDMIITEKRIIRNDGGSIC